MAENNDAELKPPTFSWSGFTGFLDEMKAHQQLPGQIDRTYLKRYSGTAQSMLTGTLAFFGLIDGGNAPTPLLREYLDARGNPGWKTFLYDQLGDRYRVVASEVDPESATEAQIKDAFRKNAKLSGDLLERAYRFYLKALEDAGVSLPSWLKKRSGSSKAPGGKRSRAKQNRPEAHVVDTFVANAADAKDLVTWQIHIPDKAPGSLSLPRDMTQAEIEVVEAQLAVVRAYLKARSASRPAIREEEE